MSELDELVSDVIEALLRETGLTRDQLSDDFNSKIREIVNANIESGARKQLDLWLAHAPEQLTKERTEYSKFLKTVQDVWGEPLQLLEALLSLTVEHIDSLKQREWEALSQDDAMMFHVLYALFGRSVHVAREIHVLLSNGYADGALARWRTLHELVVTAEFIQNSGFDTAQRYYLQQWLNAHKVMRSYKQHFPKDLLTKVLEGFDSNLDEYRDIIRKSYGKSFDSDFGWAMKALGKAEGEKVRFTDIEMAVKAEYLRPNYTEANFNVHATALGTFTSIGLPNSSNILVGYSVFGLGKVINETAFLVVQFFDRFLNAQLTIEHKVLTEATQLLLDRVAEAVDLAENNLRDQQNRTTEEPRASD